jgi:hypothetical protein
LIHVERDATAREADGRESFYSGGRAYLVSESHATALVREGYARRVG